MDQINNIKLFKRWVMVRDLPLEEKTASGLVVDFGLHYGDKAKKLELWEAEVLAVCDLFKDQMPVGTKVLYDPYSGGFDIPFNGTECFITKAENIHGVIDAK